MKKKKKYKIHIRKRWNAPAIEPAWCGRNDGDGTVTDAWGWWGPEGQGWEWVCKACVKAKEKGAR